MADSGEWKMRGKIISMRGSRRLSRSLASWKRLLGEAEVEVFQAVVGKKVSRTDRRLSVSLYMRLASQRSRNPIEWENSDYMNSYPQIGCALSHISLWERVVREDEPLIIIEDDVVVVPSVTVSDIRARIGSNALVCLMYGANTNSTDLASIENFRSFWGFQAYYITPRAARILLQRAFPLDLHIDRFMSFVAYQRRMTEWKAVVPSLPFSSSGGSTINHITILRNWSRVAVVLVTMALCWLLGYTNRRKCRPLKLRRP